MQIQTARWPISTVLRKTGFAGVTLPWSIYILPERITDAALIAHEQAHAAQIERLGVARFYLTYAWQLVRYGYADAPLEAEARAAAAAR